MAQIREFDAGNLALRPSETGVEAAAAVGRRVGGFYNQAGEAKSAMGQRLGSGIASAGDAAVAWQDHRELATGMADRATMLDNLEQSKSEVIRNIPTENPNGTPNQHYGEMVDSALRGWRESMMEPSLDKFQSGFTTEKSQRWAMESAGQIREHMFTQTSADISEAAGVGMTNSIRTTVNSSSNTVFNNPTLLPSVLDQLDHSIGALASSAPPGVDVSKLRTGVSQQAKETIVKAAVQGAIRQAKDPEAAVDDLIKQYPQFIKGEEANALAKAAATQSKYYLLAQKALDTYQRQQSEQGAHQALSQNWTDNFTLDANGRASIKPDYFKNIMDVERQYPGAATTRSQEMIRFGQEQQREKRETIVSNPTVMKKLYDGLFDTENPTTHVDLLKAANLHQIDDRDLKHLDDLRQALEERPMKGPKYTAATNAVKEALGVDAMPDGHQRYANFMETFIPEYIKADRAGTLKPDDLDLRNPNSIISKSMKSFVPEQQDLMLARIKKSAAAIMQGMGPPDTTPVSSTVQTPASPMQIGTIIAKKDGTHMKFRGGDKFKEENYDKVEMKNGKWTKVQ